jgi:aspartyl-tRNA(Asn)/glutamyl-tRNA(Gln) amidotransferase subunit A
MKELSAMLERGEMSSRELTLAFLRRIDEKNPSLNAFITVDHERALGEADGSDERRKAGTPRSPWDGIPIAVKDNICTRGLRTTCASGILRDFVPRRSASSRTGL